LLGTLLALVASPLAGRHLPACAIYVQSHTAGEMKTDAELVGAATHTRARPETLSTVMALPDWRLVWATPAGGEKGVFFFRRAGSGYRLVDTWGGVALRSERGATAAWAAKLGVPQALAQCFASHVVDGE
jgi:hypothetical protein